MENMKLYDAVRAVPESAKKKILGGRLKGMTDVNPMFRIKALTEQFGPCGKGWYTEIVERRTTPGPNGELMCFVDLNLYYRDGSDWSKPIFGTGGSTLVSNEKSGLYASDEGWKMAYTDALSVACKALGMAADVYWESDRTKYSRPAETDDEAEDRMSQKIHGATPEQLKQIGELFSEERIAAMLAHFKLPDTQMLTKQQAEIIIKKRLAEMAKEGAANG